jgi:3-isopropylmalate dehydrogenase
MADSKKLLLLPGDGIGPEIMAQTRRIIDWLEGHRGVKFEVEEDLIGGCSYDAHGTPLRDEVVKMGAEADAILLGAVGGPKWDDLDFSAKPERGLLKIRKDLDLFANLRPALCFAALADASTLKKELVEGLDIMIVRELTGGLYFGEPRGITVHEDGTRTGINTQPYSTEEVRRLARVGFELAKARKNKVHSADKSNVLESHIVWREEVTWVRDNEYPDMELQHILADNCAMQLIRNPQQFDVLLADNLYGDILSDAAAMLTGSLGMLPSASLGAADENGKRPALYEPVHGSAPDIAGQNVANPLAMILSFTMALKYSLGMGEEADIIETAVNKVLAGGMRTGDIMQKGKAKVSTSVMGDSIINELNKLSK